MIKGGVKEFVIPEGMTQTEYARQLGVSKELVRQKALKYKRFVQLANSNELYKIMDDSDIIIDYVAAIKLIHTLNRRGIYTLEELKGMERSSIARTRYIGKHSLELMEKLGWIDPEREE